MGLFRLHLRSEDVLHDVLVLDGGRPPLRGGRGRDGDGGGHHRLLPLRLVLLAEERHRQSVLVPPLRRSHMRGSQQLDHEVQQHSQIMGHPRGQVTFTSTVPGLPSEGRTKLGLVSLSDSL